MAHSDSLTNRFKMVYSQPFIKGVIMAEIEIVWWTCGRIQSVRSRSDGERFRAFLLHARRGEITAVHHRSNGSDLNVKICINCVLS